MGRSEMETSQGSLPAAVAETKVVGRHGVAYSPSVIGGEANASDERIIAEQHEIMRFEARSLAADDVEGFNLEEGFSPDRVVQFHAILNRLSREPLPFEVILEEYTTAAVKKITDPKTGIPEENLEMYFASIEAMYDALAESEEDDSEGTAAA